MTVYTLRYGTPAWLVRCSKTLDAWCLRHNLPLKIWSKWNPGYPNPKFCEVDMIADFLAGEDDQMIYVDADVYVSDDAPSPSFGPGMHIRPHSRGTGRNCWMEWCRQHMGGEPSNWTYRNAGVWVLDRPSAEKLMEYIKQPYIAGVMEQNHFNWWILLAEREGLVVNELPRVWNNYPSELLPSWFYHIYGPNKDFRHAKFHRHGLVPPVNQHLLKSKHPRPIKPMTRRNIVIPQSIKTQPSRRSSRAPNPKFQWPMHVDDLHLSRLSRLLADLRPKVAMEIGSHKGVSTQVFLDALEFGHIGHLHIVEPYPTQELKDRIARSTCQSQITFHNSPSWEILQPADFVFIDGDHGWPAYADLAVCLALQTPVIAMHDTAAFSIGIKGCHGSQGAWRILQAAPGRKWTEDNEERPGMFTHRGFGWSVALTKDPACISAPETH